MKSAAGTQTDARAKGVAAPDALVAEIRNRLGEEWPPRIYRERILTLRTRSHAVPAPKRGAEVEVQHTLLGIELKVGRRRVSCPDLATARYLAVFARAGVGNVAVPYDITKISHLADELESAWQRMLLLADFLTEGRSPSTRTRARSSAARAARGEIEEAGAGTAVPQFNQNTSQRPQRRVS
ncbi:MAG TPA: hypothetical protein VFS10_04950 [Pyrinomonadaceae bacterium]|nr:hypothetical protein [Pyrinomonadaceae bacterium]